MKRKNIIRYVLFFMMVLIFPSLLMTGCDRGRGDDLITSVEQLNEPGRRIGVSADTAEDKVAAQEFPLAQIKYFKEDVTGFVSVSQGKVDAYVFERLAMENAIYNGLQGVRLLDVSLGEGNRAAVAFSPVTRIPDLENRLNDFLEEIKADGTMDDASRRWLTEHNEVMPDIPAPENPELRLVVGTTGSLPPFTYYIGTELGGYDIELAYRFASWLNASIEFKVYSYDGIVEAALNGDVDCIFSDLFVTPERAESIRFSQPTYVGEIGVMVRADQIPGEDGQNNGTFLANLRDSFEKTFIRESRWKLFVQGIGTTLLITFFSILSGTALGFFVFMICRNGNPVANTVTRFCIWLVRGMPTVVLLMILYYIIFGGLPISGTFVSIIGFTLVFGANVFGVIKSGVSAIDIGQLEAAYTLGYTNRRAFFRIILPQAMPHFMPAYKSSITEIIKATAIVGYVAVQDLTKMGDVVRSRTYDAFFPLIAVAVIYFILAAFLTFLVNRIELRFDSKRRGKDRILKGVTVR